MNLINIETFLGVDFFQCIRCNRCYSTKGNLRRHIRIECGQEPNHKCQYCKKKFKYIHSMLRHQMTCNSKHNK